MLRTTWQRRIGSKIPLLGNGHVSNGSRGDCYSERKRPTTKIGKNPVLRPWQRPANNWQEPRAKTRSKTKRRTDPWKRPLAKRLTAKIGNYSVLVCAIGVVVFVFICISRNVFFDVDVKFCCWHSFTANCNRCLNGNFLVIILPLGNNPVATVYLD